MDYLILAINPGSTSTKVALYKNETQLYNESINHPKEELKKYNTLQDELPMRRDLVLDFLRRHKIAPTDLACVMGRGGMLPPIKTGGYLVNQKMVDMIKNNELSPHASNLAAVIAKEIADMGEIKAYIYDAVSAGELPPIAQITGMKEVVRKSFSHVLNSRAVSIKYAASQGKKYEEMNLIVAHLGGGITMSTHKAGKIVESLADDNGPFAPERSGSVPLLDVIELCYSGEFTKQQMVKKVRGMGGLYDLLGSSDGKEIMKMVEDGDEYAALVMEAQAYQIAKGIFLVAPPLMGKIDAIILTGGLAHNESLVKNVITYIDWIAPVVLMPGELELEALAMGGLRIICGEEKINEL